jgi:hypothetical protein
MNAVNITGIFFSIFREDVDAYLDSLTTGLSEKM